MMVNETDSLTWLAAQQVDSFPKGSKEWILACALSAANQRFLSLGAAVASLEARVREIEAHPAVSIPPLGVGPLEPEG